MIGYLLSSAPRPPCAETLGRGLIAGYPDEGRSEIAFHPNGSMRNQQRSVQGGFIAAPLDDTTGPAFVSSRCDKEAPVALDRNVIFLRPVLLDRIIGNGRVIERMKRTAFLGTEPFDDEGQLPGKAMSTARIVPIG